MGVRILENIEQGKAVIYDSVTDVAFGPVFRDWEEEITTSGAGEVADAFLDWLGEDPRQMRPFVRFGPGLPDLMDEYGNFIAVDRERRLGCRR